MPKPVKKATKAPKKPASDPIRRARQLLEEHAAKVESATPPWKDSQTPEPLDFEAAYRKRMAELGSKGGKIGGKRRLETMTQEQREAVALKAARARWAKAAEKKEP